jgi:hypothetical protein
MQYKDSKPVNGVKVFIPGKYTHYRIATADSNYEVAVIEARTRELALERVRLVRHLLPWLAREAVDSRELVAQPMRPGQWSRSAMFTNGFFIAYHEAYADECGECED